MLLTALKVPVVHASGQRHNASGSPYSVVSVQKVPFSELYGAVAARMRPVWASLKSVRPKPDRTYECLHSSKKTVIRSFCSQGMVKG